MATVEFACSRCGCFLNSVDGAPAICRCDGAFHEPPVEIVSEATFSAMPELAQPEGDDSTTVVDAKLGDARAASGGFEGGTIKFSPSPDTTKDFPRVIATTDSASAEQEANMSPKHGPKGNPHGKKNPRKGKGGRKK